MWAGTEPEDLTRAWAEELCGYEGSDIRMALEAMRFAFVEWPPSLFQFADLCRDARLRRLQTTRVLKDLSPKHEIDAKVLAEINQLTRNWREKRKSDPRDWARKILQREQAGERMSVYSVQCAKEALGFGESTA